MLKVAIIEDNAKYRTAVAIILQLDESLNLIHKLENCAHMIPLFEHDTPDVVLMDIDMDGMNGIEAVWHLKKQWPSMKVIMLTVFEDDEKIFGAIKAGANGYLLKKDSPQKILDAIHAASKGEAPMNGVIASRVLDYFQRASRQRKDMEDSGLTNKEKEVLQLLVKGYSYKEISSLINISIETLNSHIKNMYRKLNVHSRSELAAMYNDTR